MESIVFPKVSNLGEQCKAALLSGSSGNRAEVRPSLNVTAGYCWSEWARLGEHKIGSFALVYVCVCDMPTKRPLVD